MQRTVCPLTYPKCLIETSLVLGRSWPDASRLGKGHVFIIVTFYDEEASRTEEVLQPRVAFCGRNREQTMFNYIFWHCSTTFYLRHTVQPHITFVTLSNHILSSWHCSTTYYLRHTVQPHITFVTLSNYILSSWHCSTTYYLRHTVQPHITFVTLFNYILPLWQCSTIYYLCDTVQLYITFMTHFNYILPSWHCSTTYYLRAAQDMTVQSIIFV